MPSARGLEAWSDTVWRGERVHNQLLLTTNEEVISRLSYSVSDLKSGGNTIPASCVTLRGVDYVAGDELATDCGAQTTRHTVYLGDALTANLPSRVSRISPSLVWASIDIPSATAPGTYTGTIQVKQDDKTAVSLPVSLLVTAHSLPAVADWQFHLDLWQFPFQLSKLCSENGDKVEPFSDRYFTLMRPFYAMLADAGQKAITTYIKDGAFNTGETMVDWSRDDDGTYHFDYTKFDRFVEFMMGLGIDRQINCHSLAGWSNKVGYTNTATGAYNYMSLAISTAQFAKVWDTFLNDFRSHLTAKGWMERTVLYMDEVRQTDMARIVDVIRANGNDWKIGLAGQDMEASVEQQLFDYSTIIGTNRHTTGHTRATFYTSCSQTHPNNYVAADTEPAEMTWMAWHALARGFNGYTRWAYDYWTVTDPMNAQDATNTAGDFHMIYRTDNTAASKPVASMRLELLRCGIQDYEKVRILGVSNLTSVIALFTDPKAPNARQNVMKAQAQLKTLSAKD